jgi:integrase
VIPSRIAFKSLEELHGKLRVKGTKTIKSCRRVALPDFAVAALEDHRQVMIEEGNYGGATPVFCGGRGKQLRKSNLLRRSFRPIIEAANAKEATDAKKEGRVPNFLPRVRPVDFRHSAATLLLVAGEPLKVVSERLGHSTVNQTLTTYQHVLPGQQEKAADTMQGVIAGQLGHR